MKTTIMGMITGNLTRFVHLDKCTRALVGITYGHSEAHSRSSFVVSDVQNVSTTTMYWMVTVSDSLKLPHMLFNIECTGEMYVVITEGADRTGTTKLQARNRYRHLGSDIPLTTVHRAYTGGTTNGAKTLFKKRTGSTGVASKTITSGSARGHNEWILAPSIKYIVSVTTYADVYVTVELDWYEHTEKD